MSVTFSSLLKAVMMCSSFACQPQMRSRMEGMWGLQSSPCPSRALPRIRKIQLCSQPWDSLTMRLTRVGLRFTVVLN